MDLIRRVEYRVDIMVQVTPYKEEAKNELNASRLNVTEGRVMNQLPTRGGGTQLHLAVAPNKLFYK